MTVNKMGTDRKEEMQTRLLPKNYRQIGEPGSKKIYIEDYVYTYLNKMAQPGNLYARGAVLFGNMFRTAAGPCLFISGATSCQNIEFDLEETVFSEEVWNEIYQVRDTYFPKLEICGWFLSRMGFSVELNDKIIRMHMDNFNGDHKVLYMMDVLENEDAFYQFENYSLKKQKGYYIYYESNHEMADYMLAEGEINDGQEAVRVSSELRRDSSVVKNYKNTLQRKKTGKQQKGFRWTPAMAAGAAVVVMALVYGGYSINEFRQNERMRTAFEQAEPSMESTRLTDNIDAGDGKVSEEGIDSKGTAEDTELTSEKASAADAGLSEDLEASAEGSEQSADEDTDSQKADADSGDTESGEEDKDVFTQEDPDDVVESWAYIGGEYTVKRGDTLASISMEIYESYDYIQKIADENNIENVNQIYPGQVLKIPQIED